MINNYQEDLKYKPTKLEFKEVILDTPGFFNFGEGISDSCDSTENMHAFIEQVVDMESMIKKNFISGKKDGKGKNKDILPANPVQITLREEFERLNQDYNKLEAKLKAEIKKSTSRDTEGDDAADLQTQVDNLKKDNQIKDIKEQENKKQIRNLENGNNILKSKLRDADDKNSKLEGHMLPKLKDTTSRQKEIAEELERIHLDSQLLPAMFRAEANFRLECKKEKDDAVDEMKKAMKIHNKLVKKIADLENELARKERLAIQAIAARASMKGHLEDGKSANMDLQNVIKEYQKLQEVADDRVHDYKTKHDEMFDSVSGLNIRIDELESHKMHLFKRLESLGDRGSLDYIVKTQGLQNMKADPIKNPVTIDEDYDPAKNRRKHDHEYEEQMRAEEKELKKQAKLLG